MKIGERERTTCVSVCAAVLVLANSVAMSIFGAILQRNRALLLECLQEPGSLTARTADQRTPLMLACQTGQVAFLDLLLTSGADISAEDIVRAPAAAAAAAAPPFLPTQS